ncbi:hypothetical protein OMAG_000764 [Candidatus Omnitrophus magneticus]|uniref:Uncharacterized protein n=1 Tax=Candidatus Omnitrophus magneticus TaxID=1609969 RepID=A0A0F0CVB0_9BACT|nr:hypothetical protein OMAG_000764 [Candidatus Omnitrophus magneticus]
MGLLEYKYIRPTPYCQIINCIPKILYKIPLHSFLNPKTTIYNCQIKLRPTAKRNKKFQIFYFYVRLSFKYNPKNISTENSRLL